MNTLPHRALVSTQDVKRPRTPHQAGFAGRPLPQGERCFTRRRARKSCAKQKRALSPCGRGPPRSGGVRGTTAKNRCVDTNAQGGRGTNPLLRFGKNALEATFFRAASCLRQSVAE